MSEQHYTTILYDLNPGVSRLGGIGLKLALVLAVFAPSLVSASSPWSCEKELPKAQHVKVVQEIAKQYTAFQDLEAGFIQQSFFLGLNKNVKSEGRVLFLKPGRMDWLYESPEPQRFISDGVTLSFFQPSLKQVTLGDFQSSFSSDLPVSFLLGVGSLEEKFDVKRLCEAQAGTTLELQPKVPDPNLQQFILLVRKDDRVPLGASLTDAGGNVTTIEFKELKLNTGVKPEQFSVPIPAGSDIIDHRQAKGRP